jgi:hypothetical protein
LIKARRELRKPTGAVLLFSKTFRMNQQDTGEVYISGPEEGRLGRKKLAREKKQRRLRYGGRSGGDTWHYIPEDSAPQLQLQKSWKSSLEEVW